MKKVLLAVVVLLLTTYFIGCEKDDICSATTPTTPSVIVEFYDTDNPTVLKNVTNLLLVAKGTNKGVLYNNVSKIKVPLQTNADQTVFSFLWNYNSTTQIADNEDVITFTYTRKDEFISRACGFKTLFYFNTTNPISITPDANNWIKNATLNTPNIINENETHLKLYH